MNNHSRHHKQGPPPVPQRLYPSPAQGLSAQEAESRLAEGLSNQDSTLPTRSVYRIVRDNLCTLFNLLNLILAVSVLLVGSYKNLLFLGVVFCNLAIGIFQELRAKRTVDRLSLLSPVKAQVLREGKVCELMQEQVVLDDILLQKSGSPVVTDAILLEGECEVDESFVTGESDPILKRPGDLLLAGSFVVSGQCKCQAERVGSGNYISTISKEAKRLKKYRSEIMHTLQQIIKVISLLIIPVGTLLFVNQLQVVHNTFQDAVVQTVAALIGMIPEGLMLLTSTVMAVSVIRLSRHKVLVQELYCIEALARVDTLCLDKTGTLTEGSMELTALIPLESAGSGASPEEALTALVSVFPDQNATLAAIAEKYGAASAWKPEAAAPFSSQTKWSGASFGEKGTYLLGAPEFVLPGMDNALKIRLNALSENGRVLLLTYTPAPLPPRTEKGKQALPEGLVPLAILQLQDRLRPQAGETLRYFAEQGVNIKVISGDSMITVSRIARQAGIAHWDRCADASLLTPEELRQAAEQCTVFGRVTPAQKKLLVQTLKENGHTVAMTGDGINDVLALKEADCSIAMASGSGAARNISQLVLLNSNFDSMPRVVGEGRRSINNVQRSASLFLVKTIYSTLLAVLFLFIHLPYPFMPIQLTLISAVTIGIPAFVLALEPNSSRIQGNFLRNILIKAVPGAAAIVCNILLAMTASVLFNIDPDTVSTLCVLLTAYIGLLLLYQLCVPFNLVRKILYGVLWGILLVCWFFLPDLFSLVPLPPWALLCAAVIALLGSGLFFLLLHFLRKPPAGRVPKKG